MGFDARLLSGIGVLAAIVEGGNFARAGEVLGLTPSGISRAVTRLEARIGVRLFNRTPRAVTLTDEGRRFYAQAAPLLEALEDAAAEAGGSAASVRGRLRVNVDPWFSRLLLAPRIGAFMHAHPALAVELIVRDVLGDLVAEGFDVAVRFGVPEPSMLVARKLLETRVLTCASPAYLAQHGRPRHPRDLARHECLLFRDPVTGRPFDWEFRRGRETVDVPVQGRLVVNDLASKLAACAAGYGVTQTFELGIEPLLASGALEQILPAWAEERFPLYAYHPSRHLPPAKVRAFIDFVVASVRTHGAKGIGTPASAVDPDLREGSRSLRPTTTS
jgi:DNA-binding transcriptional LysR family regulator